MSFAATLVPLAEILPWRDRYREEMACQIIHASIPARAGGSKGWRPMLSQDTASLHTLQKAGIVPCAHFFAGPLRPRPI